MRELIVSAPGKCILFGEHAVVYNRPAIAMSVGRRTYVRWSERSDGVLALHLTDINLHREWSVEELRRVVPTALINAPPAPAASSSSSTAAVAPSLRADIMDLVQHKLAPSEPPVVHALLYLFLSLCTKGQGAVFGCTIDAWSELPVGAGLGSSAAFAVCAATCFLVASGAVDDRRVLTGAEPVAGGAVATGTTSPVPDWVSAVRVSGAQEASVAGDDAIAALVNQYGYVFEQIMHGTPSGIDNSVSTYGGSIVFRRGSSAPITVMRRVPHIRILLTNTRVEGRNTKELVAGVRKRYEDKQTKKQISDSLDAMEQIANQCINLFENHLPTGKGLNESESKQLESLIDENQKHLNLIGVGHEKIDIVVNKAKKLNLHSKLTGAGGGGCVITLLPHFSKENSSLFSQLDKQMKEEGFDTIDVELGSPGVLIHLRPSARM